MFLFIIPTTPPSAGSTPALPPNLFNSLFDILSICKTNFDNEIRKLKVASKASWL